ncbi:hypothetical protein HMPREF1210_00144 [Paenisporosarcina sp. HGH0030]|uniref:DUF262 domain-containing protein n=1 Tax=Paenisporosarcina sp. HGH0030 TaxID=1078085 RepID=UPI00034E4A0D|nr:DUF262 domain-containing protein [Paenisporosarcina sp. HGH0030]EPD54159.1 hypothetical protein HMPREF1210_00144 [Paenisporosarcina sp. HGH0030]
MAFERPLTINEVVNDIHRKKYLLPSIQREFVWDTEQIETLFDSLLRGYPVGAFLLWYVNKENINKFKFYEFLRNYHERENTHNLEANINGEEDIIAILDGQQRLTSLYIGLKGTYAYKLPRKRVGNDSAYPTRNLYLNLLKPSEEIDMLYDFKFLTEKEALIRDEESFWFKVGDILNFSEQFEINDYIYQNELNTVEKEKARYANKTLFDLYKAIHVTPSINYYLERSQSLDKVLNIFIRVNSGGTQLSYSDLLLSIATAQWKQRDARKTITSFVDEINSTGDYFDFDKDLVLKTCLVLCDFNDIAFKVDNFDSDTMGKIETEWDEIAQAIRLAVQLVASYGFNHKTLTANYVIIPISYYLYKKGNPHNFVESYKYIQERKDIHRFTIVALLKRIFGGQPDNVLKPIREIIKNNLNTFPYVLVKQNLKVTNKTLKFTEEEVENLLWTKYGNRYAFPILSLLYPNLDYKNNFHQDHIFPKSILKSRTKLKREGVSQDTIEYAVENYDYVGNLQLIEGIPNLEKSDKKFDEWLNIICLNDKERDMYREKHLIPNVDLSLVNFEDFMAKREKLIREKLTRILIN